MNATYGEQLNQIFATYEEVREDELAKKVDAEKVRKALKRSCIFLGDLLADEDIAAFKGEFASQTRWKEFQASEQFGEFLAMEASLLTKMGVKGDVVEKLRNLIKVGPDGRWYSLPEAVGCVEELKLHVCRAAVPQSTGLDWHRFFKSVAVAAGGGAIIIANSSFASDIGSHMATISITVGSQIMGHGASGSAEILKAILSIKDDPTPRSSPPRSPRP